MGTEDSKEQNISDRPSTSDLSAPDIESPIADVNFISEKIKKRPIN